MTKETKREKPPEGWKAGYKVVCRLRNGKLASYCVDEHCKNLTAARGRDPGAVYYALNQSTVPLPGCGPLAVFTAKRGPKALVWHTSSRDSLRVFKCIYRQTKGRRALWEPPTSWNGGESGTETHTDVCLWDHSDYADEVILVEEVKV